MSQWMVLCEPITDGEIAGLIVNVVQVPYDPDNGAMAFEVGRVAFVRQKSKNPKVTFEDQINTLVNKAEAAAELVNDLQAELERAREIARQERDDADAEIAIEVQAKLKKELGAPKKAMA